MKNIVWEEQGKGKRKGKEKGKGSIVKDFFYYNFHKFKE